MSATQTAYPRPNIQKTQGVLQMPEDIEAMDNQSNQHISASDLATSAAANDTAALLAHIKKTENENFQYRSQKRELKTQIEELQKKIPAEDAAVITKAEADLLERYKTLGTADSLQEQLEKARELKQTAALSRHAQLAGYNPNVLKKLLPENAKLITKTEREAGQDIEVPYIETNAGQMLMTQYVESNYPDFMPSLTNIPGAPARQSWPAQASGAPAPARELTAEQIKELKLRSTNYRSI
jgi:hypothetical protein